MGGHGPPRSAFTVVCAVVALVVCATAATGPAAADGKASRSGSGAAQVRGVNLTLNRAFVPGPYGYSGAESAAEVAGACSLGAGAIRVFVPWFQLERDGPGQIDAQFANSLDALLAHAAACRIGVLFTLLGTPQWATSGSVRDRFFGAYPSRFGPDHYGRIVAWILQRWPQLLALEVWNEPNLHTYWRGTPAEYAALVKAAAAAKQAVGSSTLILAGAIALGDSDYLRRLYASGMRGQDGISIHPYPTRCLPVCDRLYDPGRVRGPYRGAIVDTHRAMLENGDAGGMWLTEVGYASCPARPTCVPDRLQAEWMASTVQIAACYRYVEGVFAFTLRDSDVPSHWDASSWHFHFGLMNSNFQPKRSFKTVKQTFRAMGPARAGRRSDTRLARAARSRPVARCVKLLKAESH